MWMGTWFSRVMGQKTSFSVQVKYFFGVTNPSVTQRFFLFSSNETQEDEEQMNISQEILVLDFGDEKNDFLKAAESDFGNNFWWFDESIDLLTFVFLPHRITDKTVTIIEPCPTKTSVLALAVTCALMILVYISTMFCYFMKKWMHPHKSMA